MEELKDIYKYTWVMEWTAHFRCRIRNPAGKPPTSGNTGGAIFWEVAILTLITLDLSKKMI
jgi:hypothetical protein